VIGHERQASQNDERGVSSFCDPLGITPDGAQMMGIAQQPDPDAELVCHFYRKRSGAHHANGTGCSIAIHNERGREQRSRQGLCGRIELPCLNLFQITRYPHHAV
jgi:hypothetical protein